MDFESYFDTQITNSNSLVPNNTKVTGYDSHTLMDENSSPNKFHIDDGISGYENIYNSIEIIDIPEIKLTKFNNSPVTVTGPTNTNTTVVPSPTTHTTPTTNSTKDTNTLTNTTNTHTNTNTYTTNTTTNKDTSSTTKGTNSTYGPTVIKEPLGTRFESQSSNPTNTNSNMVTDNECNNVKEAGFGVVSEDTNTNIKGTNIPRILNTNIPRILNTNIPRILSTHNLPNSTKGTGYDTHTVMDENYIAAITGNTNPNTKYMNTGASVDMNTGASVDMNTGASVDMNTGASVDMNKVDTVDMNMFDSMDTVDSLNRVDSFDRVDTMGRVDMGRVDMFDTSMKNIKKEMSKVVKTGFNKRVSSKHFFEIDSFSRYGDRSTASTTNIPFSKLTTTNTTNSEENSTKVAAPPKGANFSTTGTGTNTGVGGPDTVTDIKLMDPKNDIRRVPSFFDLEQVEIQCKNSLKSAESLKRVGSKDSFEYRLFGNSQEYISILPKCETEVYNKIYPHLKLDRFLLFGFHFNKLLNSISWLASTQLSCKSFNSSNTVSGTTDSTSPDSTLTHTHTNTNSTNTTTTTTTTHTTNKDTNTNITNKDTNSTTTNSTDSTNGPIVVTGPLGTRFESYSSNTTNSTSNNTDTRVARFGVGGPDTVTENFMESNVEMNFRRKFNTFQKSSSTPTFTNFNTH